MFNVGDAGGSGSGPLHTLRVLEGGDSDITMIIVKMIIESLLYNKNNDDHCKASGKNHAVHSTY